MGRLYFSSSQGRLSVLGMLSSLLGLAGGLVAYSVLREPINVRFDRLLVRIPNIGGHIPADGLRILHISDTHFQGLAWRERTKIDRIRHLTRGLDYDLLIHTGDFWHNESGIENLLALFDILPAPKIGAFGVMGNHDYACYSHADALSRNWTKYQLHSAPTYHLADASGPSIHLNGTYSAQSTSTETFVNPRDYPLHVFRFMRYVLNVPFELETVSRNNTAELVRLLKARGVSILDNRSVHLCQEIEPGRKVDIHLAGVDDVTEGTPKLKDAFANVPHNSPTILLSHNPDILEEPASRRSDLVLSGHTHGGQIRIPIIGAVHTHSAHLGRREAAGFMRRGKTQIHVSRGVGEGIPLRFRARPHITLITVKDQQT